MACKFRDLLFLTLGVLFFYGFSLNSKATAQDFPPIQVTGLGDLEYLQDRINLENHPQVVAHELKYLLEQEGYILATARIVNNAEVAISFGAIKKVNVEGFSNNVAFRARQYFLAASTDRPHIDDIERALALTNDIFGVSATISFKRLDDQGAFEAVVTGIENRQNGQVVVDSTSKSIGDDTRFQIFQNFHSVLTGGDILRLQGSYINSKDNPNSRSVYGSYATPINNYGTYAELSAGDFQTDIPVEGTSKIILTNTGFAILPGSTANYNYEGHSASLTIGHPVLRQHDKAAYVLGSVDWSDDETETVGDTETYTGNASFFYREEAPDGFTYAVGATLGAGYTDTYHAGDTENFVYLQGSFGAIKPVEAIAPHTELLFEFMGQLGTKHTPSAKMIGLGSETFLRGYENATFIGASGVIASAEIAHAYYPQNHAVNSVTPFAFFDFGSVQNDSSNATNDGRPKNDSLASTGVGLRMTIFDQANVDGFVGVPLMADATGQTPSPRLYIRLSRGW